MKNHKKEQKEKLGKKGPLRRSKGHPRREGRSVAVLRCSEALRRGVGTVHRGKIFGFCFQTSRIRAPIVWGP